MHTGYSLFMVPSQLMLLRYGARTWLSALVTVWGMLAASFALIRTKLDFYMLRFLLGMFESGAFPAMVSQRAIRECDVLH